MHWEEVEEEEVDWSRGEITEKGSERGITNGNREEYRVDGMR